MPRYGILPGAKFTLRPSLALSYIGSVTARHPSSGHQTNCGVKQRAPSILGRAAITVKLASHTHPSPQAMKSFTVCGSSVLVAPLPRGTYFPSPYISEVETGRRTESTASHLTEQSSQQRATERIRCRSGLLSGQDIDVVDAWSASTYNSWVLGKAEW